MASLNLDNKAKRENHFKYPDLLARFGQIAVSSRSYYNSSWLNWQKLSCMSRRDTKWTCRRIGLGIVNSFEVDDGTEAHPLFNKESVHFKPYLTKTDASSSKSVYENVARPAPVWSRQAADQVPGPSSLFSRSLLLTSAWRDIGHSEKYAHTSYKDQRLAGHNRYKGPTFRLRSMPQPKRRSIHQSLEFLNYCNWCNKDTRKKADLFILRGEYSFCSPECRDKYIFRRGLNVYALMI